jgi:hypothetical protein
VDGKVDAVEANSCELLSPAIDQYVRSLDSLVVFAYPPPGQQTLHRISINSRKAEEV